MKRKHNVLLLYCKLCKTFLTKSETCSHKSTRHVNSKIVESSQAEVEPDKCHSRGKINKKNIHITKSPAGETVNAKKPVLNKKLCNDCGKILITLYKHKCNTKSDTVAKVFTCEKCGKTFNRYRTYWSHKAYSHNPKKTLYNCKICLKSFNHTSTLREHRITKHNDGAMPHICKICSKGFPTSTKIKRHMIIHNGNRTHQCKNCPSSFSQKSKLKLHTQEIHNKQSKKIIAARLDAGHKIHKEKNNSTQPIQEKR